MIPVGSKLPDLTLHAQGRDPVRLLELKRPTVVLFLPGAFSPVCTREACAFRDGYADFADLDVAAFAVVPDDGLAARRFEETYALACSVIPDAKRKIACAFGAIGMFSTIRRATFVADADGVVVLAYANALGARIHVTRALEALRRLGAPTRG